MRSAGRIAGQRVRASPDKRETKVAEGEAHDVRTTGLFKLCRVGRMCLGPGVDVKHLRYSLSLLPARSLYPFLILLIRQGSSDAICASQCYHGGPSLYHLDGRGLDTFVIAGLGGVNVRTGKSPGRVPFPDELNSIVARLQAAD